MSYVVYISNNFFLIDHIILEIFPLFLAAINDVDANILTIVNKFDLSLSLKINCLTEIRLEM